VTENAHNVSVRIADAKLNGENPDHTHPDATWQNRKTADHGKTAGYELVHG
jgi:hypothetical protein